jgi:hypothetical protein
MNKKLIFQLSLFGLAMAFATVYFISSGIEPYVWLVIFLVCSVLIAKNCNSKYFLHGFLVSMLNSVWMTAVHIILYDSYIVNHPEELQLMEKSPLPYSMRISMLMIGPVIGAVSGLVLGFLSVVMSKIIKKNK